MAQNINPTDILDRGEIVADLQAALTALTELEFQTYNDGNTVGYVHNGSAGVVALTLYGVNDRFGRVSDVTVNIPAGETAFIPLMNREMFNVGQIAQFDVDAFASVSAGFYRLGRGG